MEVGCSTIFGVWYVIGRKVGYRSCTLFWRDPWLDGIFSTLDLVGCMN